MADIYRKAQHVLVFPEVLGRRVYWAAMRLDYLHTRLILVHGPWSDTKGPQRERLERSTFLFRLCSRLMGPIVYKILRTPYLDRMWILQELLLAQQKYILSGGGKIQWDTIDHTLLCTDPAYQKRLPRSHVLYFQAALQERQLLVENAALFEYSCSLPCANVKDRIYALCGLLWPLMAIEVSYIFATEELFV
jgi:hypothetical protein